MRNINKELLDQLQYGNDGTSTPVKKKLNDNEEPQVLRTQIEGGSVDDSILDGITNQSGEGVDKFQGKQMASTAKASFKNKQAFPTGGNSTSKVQKST